MSQQQHPIDIRDQQRIADAVRFKVHFRRGPFELISERAATLEEAKAIAARLDAEHGQNGRRAMIYAITATGLSTPVAGDFLHRTGLDKTMLRS